MKSSTMPALRATLTTTLAIPYCALPSAPDSTSRARARAGTGLGGTLTRRRPFGGRTLGLRRPLRRIGRPPPIAARNGPPGRLALSGPPETRLRLGTAHVGRALRGRRFAPLRRHRPRRFLSRHG